MKNNAEASGNVCVYADIDELEEKVLRIEKEWWKIASSRDRAIREVLGFTSTKYYLLLSSLLDRERFWKKDPVLVDRLLRLREAKLQERGQFSQRESA